MTTPAELYRQAEAHLPLNLVSLEDGGPKVLLVSETYRGVWMEHLYDSILLCRLYPDKTEYMRNIFTLFLDHQSPEGQIPCCMIQEKDGTLSVRYSQIQECVSFLSLCRMAYEILGDREFLLRCYTAGKRWITWLETHRMTTGRGLVEMFVGFDTGHDNSGRLSGLQCPGNNMRHGVLQNASVLPEGETVAPILAVDMNCNFYGNLRSLAKIALLLDQPEEAQLWLHKAAEVKAALFHHCYDAEEHFFYDVDQHGQKRKFLSSTIFHLFLERVLDPNEDAALIDIIYREHLKNPSEFWTAYPFPAMAMKDPSWIKLDQGNSWGYYTQTLIALRCTLWMDEYGWGSDFDHLCNRWLTAWTEHADITMLGQELDPVTGIPSPCSSYYSSGMLFYIYASRRLNRME